MALQKGNIVQSALRQVGLSYAYNDNTSDTYKLAVALFEEVLDAVSVRTDLLFNSVTTRLNKRGVSDVTGENIFNIPVDLLSINYFYQGKGRLEGETIFSDDDELLLNYFKKTQLSEYPLYMKDFLVYSLALRIAESDSSYGNQVEYLTSKVNAELATLYGRQYVPKSREY